MESFQIENFNLRETLYSGQFFNFREENSLLTIVNGEEIFQIKQENTTIYYNNTNEESLKKFLGLDFDHNNLKYFQNDIHFEEAYSQYRGLKILHPDLFQTIISFVCSAASNQKKIENNIKLISKSFGIYNKKYDIHTFPTPEQIINHKNPLETLLECKVGYRAKFILSIAQFLVQQPNYLNEIRKGTYEQSHILLTRLDGVGSKVADCICLFALNHFEAFPVDTWIKKILYSWYGIKGNQKELESQAKEKFGKFGGYIQQYLFHFARNKKLL